MTTALSRKEFLQSALALAGAAVLLEGCSSSSTPSPSTSGGGGGTCKTNGAKDQGLDDPLHHLVVPAADVVAGTDKTYSIKGTQTHDHTVTVTAADFANLAQGTTFTVTSTNTLSHTHTFSVVCA